MMARDFSLRRNPGPGKFEGGLVIDEVAYGVSMEGFCDEQESWDNGEGWYGLIRGAIEPSDEDKASLGLTADEVAFLGQVAGCVISENSQGFVSVEWFDSITGLDEAWDEVSAMFDEDSEDENDENDSPSEPEEGDITTEDHSEFYQYGKLAFVVPSDATTEEMWEAIEAHMELTEFYPNVWSISDHGNAHIMTRDDA